MRGIFDGVGRGRVGCYKRRSCCVAAARLSGSRSRIIFRSRHAAGLIRALSRSLLGPERRKLCGEVIGDS